MAQYLPAALFGGVSATAFLARLLRPRFPIRVNCWFCDKNSIVPYGNRNCWDCPHCEQYNGFDEDGNYNKAIPAQYSETLNSLKGRYSQLQQQPQPGDEQEQLRGNKQRLKASQNFCADCNRNQLIKIKQLAAFTPVNDDNFDDEVDLFKKRLDVSLALCGSCQAKAESVIDQQNRSLMYDIASEAIFKTKLRSSDIGCSSSSADVSLERQRLLRRAAQTLSFLLVVVGLLLATSFYSRHFAEIRSKWPKAPQLNISFLPIRVNQVVSLSDSHPFFFIFSGVFLSLICVSLKNEARVYAGYSDLAVVMAWLLWLVVRLILDHALILPAAKSASASVGRTNWISGQIENLVHPAIVLFAVVASVLNFFRGFFLKPRSWRGVRKQTSPKLQKGLGHVLGAESPPHPSATRCVDPALNKSSPKQRLFTNGSSPLDRNLTSSSPLSSSSPPSTSTPPPPTSRPPSPTGSIVGQGIELRMGDIAGMSLSTGLTPKKKTHQSRSDGVFPRQSAAASVWGNVGLDSSISSGASSLERKKGKSIISPARFTGSQSRNSLPSALFGSTPNRPLISPSSFRPASPSGWGSGVGGSVVGGDGGGGSVIGGGMDLFGGGGFPADDALSTVSAPSRFTGGGSGGILGNGVLGGLFSGFSPLNSQATTPRGSDNTSTSDRLDWPPTSQPDIHRVGGGVVGGLGGGDINAIDDTFTDDSDSAESRCLAATTMKNVDRGTRKAKTRNCRRRGEGGGLGVEGAVRERRTVGADDGGHFMKIVAVVSVVANVILAFYLGTMMKSS